MEDYPRTQMGLERRFSDVASCRDYLIALRWPDGPVCPRCGQREGIVIRRALWRRNACRHETSVMAGTVFQDSKLPLTVCFRAMWQLTSQKNGISALGVKRVFGLGSYRTAWLHKLRRAMVRPGRERLHGMVKVEAFPPCVHRAVSLLKRWLLGTHQGKARWSTNILPIT